MNTFFKYYVFLSIFSLFLNAENIEKYNVDFKLLQSGKLEIREDIRYNSGGKQKHGIYRDIPYKIKVDGLYTRDIGINNIRILRNNNNEKYALLYPNNTMLRLKIGDPNVTWKGKTTYNIFYSVDMGVLDKNATHDITSWNLMGHEWRLSTKKMVAFIHLPPSLNRSNTQINIYRGRYGSTSTKAQTQWIDNHTLRIQANYLSTYEGLTADIIYPIHILDQSGKINSTHSVSDQISSTWNWLAILLLSLLSYRFWLGLGANDFQRIISTRYKAPKELSLLQSALIYDKFANNKDFSAAIVELAQRGYLTITKSKSSSMPTFTKTIGQDETELTQEMKYLLNEVLFDRADTFTIKKKSNAQARKLLSGFDKVNELLYNWSVDKNYMQEHPKKSRKNFLIRMVLLALPLLGVSIYTSIDLLGWESTFISMFNSLFIIIGLIVLISVKGWFGVLFALMFVGVSSLTMGAYYVENFESLSHIFYTPLFLLVVFFVVIWFTYKRIGKYTQKGSVVASQLQGLKRFIQRVKSDEIKRNLKRDPLYLERYLPYAILFDESKHWLKFYDDLNIEHPTWYHGNIHHLSIIEKDMQSASTVQESSSSGYSSGGGGFSGGGMGGGGGGSW